MSNSEEVKILPLGVSSFMRIRKSGLLYIDKTDLLYEMAHQDGAKVFLARPRRFGKSLLVSTLETLFRDGLTWFKDLAIADRWKDKQYNVLKLDFSTTRGFTTIEEFVKKFRVMLNASFLRCKFDFKISPDEDPVDAFELFLFENQSLVLLIDEYDAPLNSHLDNRVLFNNVRDKLSDFYDIIKSNDDYFRFIFITGILKFSHIHIFSSLNNLTDISLDSKYGALLGYTEQEINSYFDYYLIRAANSKKNDGKTKKDILKEMKQMYDGFCFDEDGVTHVYCPWSVLNFLNSPHRGLKNYWYSSGAKPSLLIKNLEKIQDFIKKSSEQTLLLKLSDLELSTTPDSLENIVILFYAGYLSIKSVSNGNANLNYSNKEVQDSLAILLLEKITNTKEISDIYNKVYSAFSSDNVEQLMKSLNSMFTSISYIHYPIQSESICQALVEVFMRGLGFFVSVEDCNSHGRSDMAVRVDDSLWIFEFKFVADKDLKGVNVKKSALDAALQQAIHQVQTRQYGQEVDTVKKLRRIGMVFSEEKRAFVRWQLDPSTGL